MRVAARERPLAAAPTASAGTIALWRIDLGAAPLDGGTPDAAERERAARFAFDRDRVRYLRGRRALRLLLGARLGIKPEALRLNAGPHGKPFLDDVHLAFNASHAEGLAFVALFDGTEVGVDVELVRDRSDIASLARGVFHESELAQFDRSSTDLTIRSFLAGWTRKEAVLKARGVGLTVDPRAIPVGLERARRAVPLDGSDFHVETVIDDGHVVASVAASGGWSSVLLHEFRPGDFLP